MSSGGGSSESTTTAEVPPELSGLYSSTGRKVTALQRQAARPGLIKPKPMQIAGPSELERRAVGGIPRMVQTPSGETYAMKGAAGATRKAGETPEITSEQILTDPNYIASQEAFRATTQPMVENSLAMAGLADSTAAGDTMARAEAELMAPIISDIMAGEERAIERQATTGAAMVPELAKIGAAETGREAHAIETLLGTGKEERGIRQDVEKAKADERARLQALAEASLFTPLGGFVPSTIGQSTVTESDK